VVLLKGLFGSYILQVYYCVNIELVLYFE